MVLFEKIFQRNDRIFIQFFCLRKKGKIMILNPLSFIWDYQYERFRKENLAIVKLFEKNF